MASSESIQTPNATTVNSTKLTELEDINQLRLNKRFNAEEWEDWMQWDGAMDSFSPESISDRGSPYFQTGSISQGSTSPSEADSFSLPYLAPIYRIPSIDMNRKIVNLTKEDRQPGNRKRKTASFTGQQEIRTRQPKGQKISHNVIEKRYRTNLNDKIARLRDSIPVLKTAFEASQKQVIKDGESGSDESSSEDKILGPNLKFNKATVLTKATEYIEQLERANAKLLSENSNLRKRVKNTSNSCHDPKPLYFHVDEANTSGSCLSGQSPIDIETEDIASSLSPDQITGRIPVSAGFRRLRAEAAEQPSYAFDKASKELPASSTMEASKETMQSSSMATAQTSGLVNFDSVQGSIPIPKYLQRNRIPISRQHHYAPISVSTRPEESDPFVMDDEEPPAWWPRNRASKLLLGSLAGLIIMEGFSANTDSSRKIHHPRKPSRQFKRGLNLLPDEFYTESRGFRAQIRQRIIEFAQTSQGKKAFPVIILAVTILGLLFLALIYLSRNNAKARRRKNSIISNPDLDELVANPAQNSVPDKAMFTNEISVRSLYSLGRRKHPSDAHDVPRKVHFVYEVWIRLKGCWRVITEGDRPIRHF